MTPIEQNIKKIREACIEANPDIVALKFGCEVKIGGGFKRLVWQILFNDDEDCDRISHVLTESDRIGMVQISPVESLEEIIGRPIRLADVLTAIRESGNGLWGVTDDGVFIQVDENLNIYEIRKESWPLSNDNLNEVSDETASFIANLL